jgi:AGZA family xanthine/uracil permease-like MFS transporter
MAAANRHELWDRMRTQALPGAAARWCVPGDLDGYFALFFSSLPDLLLIASLLPLCGFSPSFVNERILPGVALSIVGGNIFYAWQAHQLARRSGRGDVTAIPFGVNLPTIFAYIFLIMLPVYQRTHDAHLAWQAGVFASFASGIVQTLGAFCTDWLRRNTPRAALLCPLAGIALAYLALGFIFGIFEKPAIALFPATMLLVIYGSRMRLPFRIPAGLLCLVTGALLAAFLRAAHLYNAPIVEAQAMGVYLPHPVNVADFVLHSGGWHYLAIILPMSMLDTLVSLQILESVKLAGDDFPTRPSLLANGLATLAAAFFGSPFPTTLYFGHMAHKDFGARTGYSILSGVSISIICMTGLVSAVLRFVPIEVVSIVVVWFGLVMVGQAFQEVRRSHCIAVAFGLIPMLAAWALGLVTLAITKSGATLYDVAARFGSELPIYGVIALSQGAILISMVWAAALAWVFDRHFLRAAAWMAVASLLSCVGLIHAYTLSSQGVENKIGYVAAPEFALSYAACAVFLVGCHWYGRKAREPWLGAELDL